MKIFNIFFHTISAAILITNLGCSKLVDIDLPKDQMTTEKVFADSSSVNSALVALYINSSGTFANSSIYPSMSADDLYPTSLYDNIIAFHDNSLTRNDYLISTLWSSAYSSIYKINACLEGIENSTGITAIQKANFLSEAKIFRAISYFHLVNLFENIPLVLTTDYNKNKTLGQSNKAEIYKQILQDLLDAQERMTKEFSTVSRISKEAISALLARIYLYNKQYNKAEIESSKVINSHLFTLADSPSSVFLPTSKETIWAISSFSQSSATTEGFNFIPSSSNKIPNYILTENLMNYFDLDDLRKQQWIGTNVISNINYYYPYKYKQRQVSNTVDKEKSVLLRLAELYLIRAEAYAQIDKYELAEKDINRIRVRAGLSSFKSDGNKEHILAEINRQRRLEFFCEGGHRWYDLKRIDKASAILSPLKPNWKKTAELYPIPQSELNKNPYLKQNPDY